MDAIIKIRLLEARDAEKFKALRLRAIADSPAALWPTHDEAQAQSIAQTAARIQPTSTVAVYGAFLGDELVAITGVRREPLSQVAHKANIWGVFVDAAQRGKGIAQRLLKEASAHASSQWQVRQLTLCVHSENTAAKKLYAACGYTTFGVEPRALQVAGRFYDEEHMFKSLDG
jgi:RimJ/RimL family protein N-acetyltransferase